MQGLRHLTNDNERNITTHTQVISANSFKPIEPVSSFDKFRLMRRLRKIGGILMTLHNVLMMEAPYDLLEKLFRKCCVRCVFRTTSVS